MGGAGGGGGARGQGEALPSALHLNPPTRKALGKWMLICYSPSQGGSLCVKRQRLPPK